MKKLAVIGAIALIVFGCVLAAGCTSSTQQTGTADKLVGAWTAPVNIDNVTGDGIIVLNKDGKGLYIVMSDDGTKILYYNPLTWKRNDSGKMTITNSDTSKSYTYTYDAAKDTLTGDANKITRSRMDPITGIWFLEGADDNGKMDKSTHMFRNNGTGYMLDAYEDGTVIVSETKWVKNTDGSYTITTSLNEKATWKINTDNDRMTSSTKRVFSKKFTDSYYYLSILGPWYSTDTKTLIVLNGDGTGTCKYPNSFANFTWTIPEFGKFKIHYITGKLPTGEDISGKERTWTYDRENNVFIVQDGTKYTRPQKSMDGVTMSAETQVTPTTACPVIGQWVTQVSVSGKPHYAIQTIKKDGTGYWMVLENDIPYVNLIYAYTSEFDKTDWDGTFDKKSSDGKTYQMVFNPKDKTLTETISADEIVTYTKADPIVGIWYGESSSTEGGKTSTTFKPDGTGITFVSYKDNGTAGISPLTWKKNTEGSYDVAYGSGEKRTYTVDSTGNKMLSSGGSVKQKAFVNDSYLVSIIGAWYNSDTTRAAFFNADSTGFFYGPKYGLKNFTWKMNEVGKFTLTYIDGKAEADGSSLKGKTTEWTYDRTNKTFTSGVNFVFTRPTETIKDRFTVYLS